MRESGRVKFWNSEKGFGFLLRDGQQDCFIHKSDLDAAGLDSLSEGQSVQFDVVAGREGRPKAQNISIGLP